MARILIVEDDGSDQLLLRSILEGAGHEIHVARDGERGFKTYLRKDIQVVVTDLHMPNVDGFELIDALLSMFPEAAIIAVSGKGQTLLDEAVKMGALIALNKPVDPDELLEAVENAVSGG